MNRIITHASALALTVLLALSTYAQQPHKPTSVDIHRQLEKFNFLGTALYVAAHPDDENTRLISYLSNDLHARTAYLSLTRGGGGQNRIGKEIGPALGYLRTHELLAARAIDGGQQFFSRATDFGYSKHPDETLAIWNKDEVLHDMVKVYREFRPDVIINRFNHRTPGRTHGHHTSSAMLSLEAIELAADPEYQKDRLGHLDPWQVHLGTHNTSWWFYGSRENFDKADKSNLIGMDAGVYYDDLGLSNTEIASLARSQHKCQGFGSTGTRGTEMEYLEIIYGDVPEDKSDLFDGVNTTWSRVEGGEAIGQAIETILADFDYRSPSSHIPALVEVYRMTESLTDEHWKNIKQQQLKDIIMSCAGVYIEAVADEEINTPGDQLQIKLEAINRSDVDITMTSARIGDVDFIKEKISLKDNESSISHTNYTLPADIKTSNPYWLNAKGQYGMYGVDDIDIIGAPINDPILSAQIELSVAGLPLSIEREVVYKMTDPVSGEVYRPLAVVPEASVRLSDPVYIYADRTQKDMIVTVKAYTDSLRGLLKLDIPNSWQVTPISQYISLDHKGEEAQFTFKIKPPYLSESAHVRAVLSTDDGQTYDQYVQEINYDHVPRLHMLVPAQAKIERIDLKKQGNRIAYIPGAGDLIAPSLRQVGYMVDEINVADITVERLKEYDATILGIRAHNTKADLSLKKSALQEYMEQGGTVIVQYTTPRRGIKGDDIAPYPMTLSRDRVTDERAIMSFELPDHEVLNYPNKISSRDFDHWVQERGLYFASEWSDEYQTPLAASDKGAPMTSGGLLIAPVGDGHFIYTGISWFRQLPAGVPGAYRLFTNLISIGKNEINDESTNGGK